MSKKNIFESNNPMMKESILDSGMVGSQTLPAMTVSGAVNKTFILGIFMFMAALVSAYFTMATGTMMLIYGGFIGGAIISFIAAKNLEKSSIFAPMFAVFEGLAVGGMTVIYASLFQGIVFQAVSLTFGILFTMLTLYKTGIIKVTERLRNIIMTAVGAIMIVYLVEFVLHLVGIDVPFLHDQSPIGIGISLVIVGVASFKLLVDFDNFDKGEQHQLPNYMEWYYGMGLLFTLIWLYLEILY
ncbi:MAG TPA: Bax inhibitor-1/YccA family protein, partial [Bacteroidetes bacterium]|nr:Bax inhibitor-1/YccA family protein [Bacteroidota bacterium]